jgi:hypothetical protein
MAVVTLGEVFSTTFQKYHFLNRDSKKDETKQINRWQNTFRKTMWSVQKNAVE